MIPHGKIDIEYFSRCCKLELPVLPTLPVHVQSFLVARAKCQVQIQEWTESPKLGKSESFRVEKERDSFGLSVLRWYGF